MLLACPQAILFICSFTAKLNILDASTSTCLKEDEVDAKSRCREINTLLIADLTLGRPAKVYLLATDLFSSSWRKQNKPICNCLMQKYMELNVQAEIKKVKR